MLFFGAMQNAPNALLTSISLMPCEVKGIRPVVKIIKIIVYEEFNNVFLFTGFDTSQPGGGSPGGV
jgi:hypothetical protein